MQTIPSNFWQWLFSLQPRDQIPMVIFLSIVAAILIFLVVTVLSFTAYKVHRNKLNDGLKRDLMERGMSAEEIVAVIRSVPVRGRDRDQI